MLPTVITTSALPEREQFAFWREACAEVLLGIRPEPPRARPGPFRAAMTATAAHGVHCMHFESDPHEVERGCREIGRVPWNACMIYRQLGPGSLFTRERERDELVMRPGDLVVTDTDVPFGTRSAEGYRHRVWLLPRAALEPHLPADRLPLSVHLPAEGGLQGLLSDYLDALSGRLDALPEFSAGQVVDHLARLVALACTGATPPAVNGGREAVRAARLARARRYIERHLGEPGLTPALVAREVGVSERQLQLLFEREGETFTRYLTRRRLEEVRAALGRKDAGPSPRWRWPAASVACRPSTAPSAAPTA